MLRRFLYCIVALSSLVCVSLRAQDNRFQSPKYRFVYDSNGNMVSNSYTFLIGLVEPLNDSEEPNEELSRRKDIDVFSNSEVLSIVRHDSQNTYGYILYSVAGQLLKSGSVSEPRVDILLSDFPYNAYILTVTSATTRKSWKILKTQNPN